MKPSKYKNTELGPIPEDWDCNDLQYFYSYISYGFTNPMPTVSEGIYMVTANDVKDGRINFESARKTSEDAYKYLLTDKSRPKKNDILLTKDGSLGRLALVGDEKICINQSVAVIRPNEKVYPLFLKLLLEDKYYQRTMIVNAGGSTIKHIYITIVNKMKLGIPPLTEQKAIAAALSDTDALISSLEQLISKKRAIKQGAMQELLRPKDGWEVKKLGEVGKCHRGVSYNPERDLYPYDKDITVRLLRSNNIQNQNIAIEGLQYVDNERVRPNQILKNNDIVICMANGSKQLVGKSAVYRVKDHLKYTFGAFMGCFRTNIELAESLYIAINFHSFQYRNYIDVLLSGTSINNLNPGNIESIEIPFPSPEEQTRIATILSDMDTEIENLEIKLDKYKQIKQGMMQQLLTGKIRLV